jgi:hypothetical protein
MVPSARTGGLDVVAQISIRTVCRLLAMMHRNSDANTEVIRSR